MKREFGFTLVELLVVIAIISILAGIVIPNVPQWIAKARMTRAFGEVKNIDLALTKMLTDANRQDFRSGFFVWDPSGPFSGEPPHDWTAAAGLRPLEVYQNMFYILLRKGKNAETDPKWPAGVAIDPDVRRKLGDTYMDLGADPWGQLYYFYPGPWRPNDVLNIPSWPSDLMPFRIYFPDTKIPGGPVKDGRSINTTDPDGPSTPFDIGYPASKNLTVYVWSAGMNLVPNQGFYAGDGYYDGPADEVGLEYMGGGDDINNWDNDASWAGHYS
ncbi:MAG: prepilin-type N-terminal cleavage/methylation domain-containing protein [Candidatus Hydrogenedentes bacterium]|nr:prepilin-type N-terminal cleavage/methylation domain-containing protein [Candidatus Hydrogenedentota bacterium]